MNCPNCGTANEAGFQFCKNCGTKLAPQQPQYQAPQQPQYQAPRQPQYQAPQQPHYQAPQQPQYQAPQQPQYQVPRQPQYQAPQQSQYQQYQAPAAAPAAPKKNPLDDILAKIKGIDFKGLLNEPKKLVIPGAAVAAVLVLIILISAISSAGGGVVAPKMTYYGLEVEDEYMLMCDDKVIEEGLEYVYFYSHSMDGSVAVYESDEELFAVNNKKIVSITDDYYDVMLSVNGSSLLVTDSDGVLTLYNTKNGEPTEIAEEVDYFCMSPDGKAVVYSVYDSGDSVTYLYKGKDSIELGEELTPVAVSNGAKYIYCIDNEKDALCLVDTKGNVEKISSDIYWDMFYMNQDHTQMIFQADGKWYATVKGGEKIKLTSDYEFDMLIPEFSARFVHEFDTYSYIITVPTNDLRNTYVVLDDSVSYLDNKWEMTKAAKDAEEAYVSADGKTLVYLKDNGKLYKATPNKLDDPVELAEDVWHFVMTSDASAVYYLNDDDELIYQKGTKEGKRVADDVDGMFLTVDDYCLFGSDEEIYSTKNGGKKVKLSDEIYDLYVSATVIYMWTEYDDGECNIYASTNGVKFKPIYEY